MTEYIRGLRQFKAMFYFLEQLWLLLIGRDSRWLEEWEKDFVVYSGIEFRRTRLKSIKRELEIIFGFAKPYKIVFAPTFWESLRELEASEDDIKEMSLKYDG